jgi:NAD-dependent deacetylase
MTAEIERLRELLRGAERILIFTGAGVSTASNIPDYRGPAGLYRTSRPVYFDAFLASEPVRKSYWRMKCDGYRAFADARPNPAHLAIVELERRQRVESVVTQNIDGLHRAAGTSKERLIELHGTALEVECVDCAARERPARAIAEFEHSGEPPRCASCGGLLKPAVIMFGQPLRAVDLERAERAALAADLVLSLGSSLVVRPAADIPLLAARRGVPYVIINQGETPHDAEASLRIDADVSRVLPEAIEGWSGPSVSALV